MYDPVVRLYVFLHHYSISTGRYRCSGKNPSGGALNEGLRELSCGGLTIYG